MRVLVLFLLLCLNVFSDTITDNNSSKFILKNDNFLKPELIARLDLIGSELYDKTGVFLGLSISDDLSLEDLSKFSKIKASNYDKKIFLIISKKAQKISLIDEQNILSDENKKYILDPRGPIFNVIGSSKSDKLDAALQVAAMQGFAEIAERLEKQINNDKLENEIGDTNHDIINILRILVWAFVIFVLFYMIQRRMKRKRQNEETNTRKRKRF